MSTDICNKTACNARFCLLLHCRLLIFIADMRTIAIKDFYYSGPHIRNKTLFGFISTLFDIVIINSPYRMNL